MTIRFIFKHFEYIYTIG